MATENRIVPLDELDDFKVAKNDPDVRGWSVIAMDGTKIGDVDELLVDPDALKVRYLDVDLDRDFDRGDDRHILIPIGYAKLDEDDDRVHVDRLSSSDLRGLPRYRKGSLTREYETDLRRRFDAKGTSGRDADSFYDNDAYDDSRFSRAGGRPGDEQRMTLSEEQFAITSQEHPAGEVDIRKDVEIRHVEAQVPVRHEEVVVERRAASPDAGHEARIEGGEVRIPLREEKLEVHKRAVPTEELVIRKQEVVEERKIEGDLRREQADIQKRGDANIREEQR